MPVLCELGLHEWQWQYLKQNSCDRQLVCTRCGRTKGTVETVHEWNKTYVSSGSCEMQETCSRCGETTGPISIMHEWAWIARSPCITEQVCRRCGATGQTDETEHDWRRIYKPHSCEIQDTCERCGTSRRPPTGLTTFVAQDPIKQSLIALIVVARNANVALDHLLLCGPPGMGKATLARSVADEMGVGFRTVVGGTAPKASDLAATLTNLRGGDVLLIDEIQRMPRMVAEMLYPAMEDFALDIVIGKGPGARSIRLKLPHLTIVGTTSRPPQVDPRLRHSMMVYEFSPYDIHQIGQIILSQAAQQDIAISSDAAALLAKSSGGIPGTASILLKRVHTHAIAFSDGQITSSVVEESLASYGFGTGSPIPDAAQNGSHKGRPPIPDDVKMFVWQRDGGSCVKCGSQENLEFDHVIPLSKGGSNTARNLQLLCERCNRSKGAAIA